MKSKLKTDPYPRWIKKIEKEEREFIRKSEASQFAHTLMLWHKYAPKSEIIDFNIVYEDVLGSNIEYSEKEVIQIKKDALKILKSKYGITFRWIF